MHQLGTQMSCFAIVSPKNKKQEMHVVESQHSGGLRESCPFELAVHLN